MMKMLIAVSLLALLIGFEILREAHYDMQPFASVSGERCAGMYERGFSYCDERGGSHSKECLETRLRSGANPEEFTTAELDECLRWEGE
jgi:hypothetical protein